MDALIMFYIKGKVIDFVRKSILELELTQKGKKGIEKTEMLLENFWSKAEKFIIEEQKRDIKWLPNSIENFGEEVSLEVIKKLKEMLDIRQLAQEIFDQEKKENPEIF